MYAINSSIHNDYVLKVWDKLVTHYDREGFFTSTCQCHDGGEHGLAYMVWGDKSLQTINGDGNNYKESMAGICQLWFDDRLRPEQYRPSKWHKSDILYGEFMVWMLEPDNLAMALAMKNLYWFKK